MMRRIRKNRVDVNAKWWLPTALGEKSGGVFVKERWKS